MIQTVSHFRRHSRAIKNFPPFDSDSEIAWSPISGFLPRTHLTLSNILLQTCLRQSSLRLTQDEVSVPPGISPQCCPLYEDLQSPALRSPIEIIIQLACFLFCSVLHVTFILNFWLLFKCNLCLFIFL